MLFLMFVVLMTSCVVTWISGFSPLIIFGLAVATWVAFYLFAYPKVRSYKITMGVDDKLNGLEAKGWSWVVLHMKGVKVVLLGAVTSLMPFAADFVSWLGGQNLVAFFGEERGARATFWVGLAVFAIPFISSWLHVGAVEEAARVEPKA